MSALEILVIAVLAIGLVVGFCKGLLAQVGSILGFVAGVVVCRLFGPQVVAYFSGNGEPAALNTAVCYALLFVVAYFGIWLVVRLVRGVVRGVHLGILDRLAGAVYTAFVWAFLLSVALNVVVLVQPGVSLGRFGARTVQLAPAVCGYVVEHARA